MTPIKTLSILVVLIAVVIGTSGLYVVTEGQQAIVLRLGKIVTESDGKTKLESPGLHFKLPLIDSALRFDMRLQTDAAKSSRIYIERESYFVVDYYVKWRINNLSTYYTSTGGMTSRAEMLMEQKIDNGLRAEFGQRSLKEVVAQDRVNIMVVLKKQANESIKNLGITIVDVRLKAIDLPDTVRNSVFNSMRAGQRTEANRYRANGDRLSTQIRAEADGKRVTILASAERDANNLRAKGQAMAAKIYADAYNRDPQFYAFLRSMSAYKDIFANQKDLLILKPDGDFFRYFTSLKGSGADANLNAQKPTS